MKRNLSVILVTYTLIMMCVFSCTKNNSLQVKKIAEAVYENAEGKKLQVVFYSLSDNSLNFVKINYDEKQYTLPQLISASGARYSDEFSMEFWVKGNEAYVTTGFGEVEKREEFVVQ